MAVVVIENAVPAVRRLPPSNPAVPFAVTEDYIGIDDFIDRTHLQISRSRHFSRQRDGTFREGTGESESHVSVWRLA